MKACVLHGIGDLRFEEVSIPRIKPGEVLVRIVASGICGSDIPRVLTKGTYHFPTIPGHEFAGVVEQIGEQVDASWLNEHVAVFPLLPCGLCSACESGNYAQCENYNYFGSRCDGGFAEYLAVPVWNLVKVPKSIPLEQAAMCEPAAVAYHAVKKAEIQAGQNSLIVGAGTIGLLAAMWSRINGAAKTILLDIDSRNLALAKQLGFEAFRSDDPHLESRLQAATAQNGIHASIECAGVSAAAEICLNHTNTFGTVIFLGNPAGSMQFSQSAYWQILRKELRIEGSWNSGYLGRDNDWTRVIGAMESGALDVFPLITHRFALGQCGEAFAVLTDKETFTIKVLFVGQERSCEE